MLFSITRECNYGLRFHTLLQLTKLYCYGSFTDYLRHKINPSNNYGRWPCKKFSKKGIVKVMTRSNTEITLF